MGLLGGVFAVIHPGHLHLFKEAKQYCDQLVVVVASDRVASKKGYEFLPPVEDRCELVRSVRYVDKVLEGNEDGKKETILEMVEPDVVFLGYDQVLDVKVKVPVIRLSAYKPEMYKTRRFNKDGYTHPHKV